MSSVIEQQHPAGEDPGDAGVGPAHAVGVDAPPVTPVPVVGEPDLNP